jgi:FMN-dependent NADH-azoreductase
MQCFKNEERKHPFMKALIIKGSYRDNNTAALVDSFAKGLKSKNPKAIIEIIDLRKAKVEFCTGCYKCAKTKGRIGRCVIKDDMQKILPKMLDCDLLVLATPIYEMGPTALMKRFMERNLPILSDKTGFPKGRNPRRKDKTGVILMVSGAPYPINVILGFTRYPSRILGWLCRLWSCGSVKKLAAGAMEGSKQFDKWKMKAYDLGYSLG